MDTSTIWLIIGIIGPWALYVGYSEVNRCRQRKQDEANRHRRELRAEADSRLQNIYGPLLYRLEVAAHDPAREQCRKDGFNYVLSLSEVDAISSLLAASRHLVSENILWCWEKRFERARWVQWGANQGTGGPLIVLTGYACDLGRMWQTTKSDYDTLMKQYQDNR